VFAVIVPHLKYLRESLIAENKEMSLPDDFTLCSTKAAINMVSTYTVCDIPSCYACGFQGLSVVPEMGCQNLG